MDYQEPLDKAYNVGNVTLLNNIAPVLQKEQVIEFFKDGMDDKQLKEFLLTHILVPNRPDIIPAFVFVKGEPIIIGGKVEGYEFDKVLLTTDNVETCLANPETTSVDFDTGGTDDKGNGVVLHRDKRSKKVSDPNLWIITSVSYS